MWLVVHICSTAKNDEAMKTRISVYIDKPLLCIDLSSFLGENNIHLKRVDT